MINSYEQIHKIKQKLGNKYYKNISVKWFFKFLVPY